MPPLVIITETLDPDCATWLGQHVELRWCRHENRQELEELLHSAEGLVVRTYTRVDTALLRKAPGLKVVGRAGVGLDRIDLEACQDHGVRVVYTPEANTQAVVEYVLGLMLDAVRPRFTLQEPVTAERFLELRARAVGQQLDQLTLGILGFGRIGRRLGAIAHAIGMNVLANDLLPEARVRKEVSYPFEFVDKPTLYRTSDIVSVHVDGRAANRHLVDARALGALKPGALFINAARGMVVDPAALAAWARRVADEGGRAVLDVHEPEPPPRDDPLYGLRNVRLLPHIAACTTTAQANMSWVVRDVWAVLEGRDPEFPAN